MSGSVYAGNLQRTGEYHTRGVPLFHEVLWSFDLSSDPSETDYPNSLLLQGGIVYAGYGDHACCAIDAQTGKLRWRFEIEELPAERRERVSLDWEEVPHRVASIALTATTALVGTNCGIIYGIDSNTGEQIWRLDAVEIDQDHEWYELCVRYMDVVDNLLLVSIDQEEVNDGAGNIYAIDLVSKRGCSYQGIRRSRRSLIS
ncbi:MAG TPA: PQQ-binding-like beta-propeller repeat protein, partial [Ktedonobacteraceae bacterium]